ncbi:MAG: cysteine-rich secretory family protein [Ramlibacter sp.]|nr:cysteine-rich secretory family protein [Ramlibacter sp.]
MLQQVNQARASGQVCGTQIMPAVPALAWNDVLFSAAARHSQDMADRNYFSHDTPEGVSFSQRLTAVGYAYSAAGENIAAGQTSVSQVMAGWLASEGHCRNIMQPVFREVGVACVAKSGTTYGTYWSMELGVR